MARTPLNSAHLSQEYFQPIHDLDGSAIMPLDLRLNADPRIRKHRHDIA